ncbi:MAG: phosphocholine cytidylyltransferase family protein [Fibromonadales bacterium]|nr:phosphocholine cytidylyltransferase family protein [Fibromonadales bacterium]
MKAVILAAGVGSRFKEFTKDKPKCLLDIGGETLLDREIRFLNELGFEKNDIIVMGGYKAEMLEGRNARIVLNELYDKTDNSFTLGLALEQLAEEDAIIMDGDLLFEREMLSEILNCKEKNAVLSKKSNDLSESTGILTNENGYVLDIGKHLKNTGYVYISIFKVGKQTIPGYKAALLAKEKRGTWYTSPLSSILAKHAFFNLITEYKWHEVDDAEDYIAAKNFFNLQ